MSANIHLSLIAAGALIAPAVLEPLPPQLIQARAKMLADPLNAGAFATFQAACRDYVERFGGTL